MMKKNVIRLTALCLSLCVFALSLSACTQTVSIRFVDKDGNDLSFGRTQTADTAAPAVSESVRTSETEEPAVTAPESTTASAETAQTTDTATTPETTAAPETATKAPETTAASETATKAPETTAAPETTKAPEVTTNAPAGFTYQPLNKKGDLYKAEGEGKIWAKLVGSCYVMFKDIDAPNEWGEQGKVYELYVTYIRVGENYSMWADGYWELSEDGKTLSMTPVNQGDNGSIGVEVGSTKTFTADNGRFTIPISFEQGGGTSVILDLSKPLA